jgi:hypothetical protein
VAIPATLKAALTVEPEMVSDGVFPLLYPDASRGPPREELPLPSKPPYTAFVGNLSFETSEGDLSDFFSGLTVRLITLVEATH